MKNRIVGLLLAVAMLVGMLPLEAITAFAEEEPEITEYFCFDVCAGAYIETDIKPSSTTRVVMDAEVKASTNTRKVFGVWSNDKFEVNCTPYSFGAGFGSKADWVTSFASGRHRIELGGNEFKLDGETKYTFKDIADFECSYKMYLFAINAGNEIQMEPGQQIRFYSCEVYENGTLAHKFVPAKKGSTFGVLDTKKDTDNFLAFNGTGTVTVVPRVTNEKKTATCTEDGLEQYYEFEGKYYEDKDCTKIIPDIKNWSGYTPAKGHTWGATDNTLHKCSVCEKTEAHTWEITDETHKCSVCGFDENHIVENDKCTVCGKIKGKYIVRSWKNGELKETEADIPEDVKVITTETDELESGWYILTSSVEFNTKILVKGTTDSPTNIILSDGCTLTANSGINIEKFKALNIYGRQGESGKIVATGDADTAGIGSSIGYNCGNITVYGGTVTATGGDFAAGIGGGRNGNSGIVAVYGGKVTAYGGDFAAGIGGGTVGHSGAVTVYGGEVTANGGENGAGIGGGDGGNGSGAVTVYGGEVTANGGINGAGIGGGYGGNSANVFIYSGTVNANGGDNAAGIGGGSAKMVNIGAFVGGHGGAVVVYGGTVTAVANTSIIATMPAQAIGHGADGIVDGSLTVGDFAVIKAVDSESGATSSVYNGQPYVNIHWHNYINGECTVCGGTQSLGTYIERSWDGSKVVETEKPIPTNAEKITSTTTSLEAGKWYVVSGNITVPERITVDGTANLILMDGYTLTADKGIDLTEGNTLNVYGQKLNTGTLDATLVSYSNTGIGSMNGNGGTLTVHGGTVTAKGGLGFAAIGGSTDSTGGAVTVLGGTVTATGGGGAAGIGGSSRGSGGDVTVYGGTVSAQGGIASAGIGGGSSGGKGGTVTVWGGTVNATGNGGGAGIGGGNGGNGGSVYVYGGAVTATGGGNTDAQAIGHGANASGGGSLTVGVSAVIKAGNSESEAVEVPEYSDEAYVQLHCHNYDSNWNCTECGEHAKYIERSLDGSKVVETEKPIPTNATEITSSTTFLDDGNRYVVSSNITVSGRITVDGTANLILMDGCTLKAENGIFVKEDNALNIYGQTGNSGTIEAKGSNGGAGIGGYGGNGGTVNIYGGIVTAKGGNNAAGIGGGIGGAGGNVTVYGGTVNATGNGGGAGIGGGFKGDGGNVSIYGGFVTAVGGDGAQAIGHGVGGTGGNLTVGGSAVIKAGDDEDHAGDTEYDGQPYVNIHWHKFIDGECTVCGKKEQSFGKYISRRWDDSTQKVIETEEDIPEKVMVITSGTKELESGWYVLASNVEINEKIIVLGTPKAPTNIILMDGYTLTVNAGINVSVGKALNIFGQKDDKGELIAKGGNNAAGIGGGGAGGNVTVNGGIIDATGGTNGAGIGGGLSGAGSNVTVNGGIVTAQGGNNAAGIGGGGAGAAGGRDGGNVTVNGGIVTAQGGASGAGIGGGFQGDGDNVTVNGGIVTAQGGANGAGIGGGGNGNGGDVKIYGGIVTAIGNTDVSTAKPAQAIGRAAGGSDAGSLELGNSAAIRAGDDEDSANATLYTNQAYVQIHWHSFTNDRCAVCGQIRGKYTERSWNEETKTVDESEADIPEGAIEITSETKELGSGWYVLASNVQIDTRIKVLGTSNDPTNIILMNGCDLSATFGIDVPEGNVLNIYGQKDDKGMIHVLGNYYDDAGIGGSSGNGGTVNIFGGTVYAIGGENAAGIGGGNGGNGGDVTVYGGTVSANDNNNGAGIGGGNGGNGGNVTVYDGEVIATGGNSAAGIGGGNGGNGGVVTVYGGEVTATGDIFAAGIGGGDGGRDGGNGDDVTIYGGTVNATGGMSAAGIGGGNGGNGGTLTIYGGTVNSTGGNSAAGIGGGAAKPTETDDFVDGNGGNVTIYGGTVNAKGGDYGAGIGGGTGGNGGDVTVNGGTVTATGGNNAAGIGGGYWGNGGNVTVNGGTVTATGGGIGAQGIGHGVAGYGIAGIVDGSLTVGDSAVIKVRNDNETEVTTVPEYEGQLYVNIHWHNFVDGVCTVCEEEEPTQITGTYIERSWNKNTKKVEETENNIPYGAKPITETTTKLGSGWYVLVNDVAFDTRITVTGTPDYPTYIILMNGYTLRANGGINVPQGNALYIFGQTGDEGILIAEANNIGGAAGIGGYCGNGGSVTVNGGNVTAIGTDGTAGIGGGINGNGGTVTVYGGTVKATGGKSGAGIGGGDGEGGNGGNVTVYGGNVTAIGGDGAAGIGGGNNGNGGTVTVYGGTVSATGDENGAGIGGGNGGNGGNVTVTGGKVTATGNGNSAGIGGGYRGNGGCFIITGGTVTVKSTNGPLIGKGVDGEDNGEILYLGGVIINGNITPAHEHTYSTEWSYNELVHWHAATCGHTTVEDFGAHEFEVISKDGVTTYTCFCGYQKVEYEQIDIPDEPISNPCAGGHSYQGGICAVCGAAEGGTEDKALGFYSASLHLDEDIDVTYAVTVPEGYENPRMVFFGSTGSVTVTDYTESDGKLHFTYEGITPQRMGDNIHATLLAEKDGALYYRAYTNYSVRQYCVNMLKKTNDESLITLLSDLLTYGAAAQTYVGYKTDALVTNGLTLTPSTFEALSDLAPFFTGTADEAIYWRSAGLTLNNSVAMNFTFYAESADDLTVRVSVNGREQTFTAEDFTAVDGRENTYRITFRGINATEFDDAVTAEFLKAGKPIGNTLSYTVNTYICAKQADANAALADLVKALYNYGASAAAYSAE